MKLTLSGLAIASSMRECKLRDARVRHERPRLPDERRLITPPQLASIARTARTPRARPESSPPHREAFLTRRGSIPPLPPRSRHRNAVHAHLQSLAHHRVERSNQTWRASASCPPTKAERVNEDVVARAPHEDIPSCTFARERPRQTPASASRKQRQFPVPSSRDVGAEGKRVRAPSSSPPASNRSPFMNVVVIGPSIVHRGAADEQTCRFVTGQGVRSVDRGSPSAVCSRPRCATVLTPCRRDDRFAHRPRHGSTIEAPMTTTS